jgi:hypothetical protein
MSRGPQSPMHCPPAHFSARTMFSRFEQWDICLICGAHLPAGEAGGVAGDLHWTFHNDVEDRIRRLEVGS